MRPSVSRYVNIEVNSRTDGKPNPNLFGTVKRLILPEDMDIFRIHITPSFLLDGQIPFTSYRIIAQPTAVIPTIVSYLSISDSAQRSFSDGYKLSDTLVNSILNPLDPTEIIETFQTPPALVLDRRGQHSFMKDDLYLLALVPNLVTPGSGQTIAKIASVCFEGYLK